MLCPLAAITAQTVSINLHNPCLLVYLLASPANNTPIGNGESSRLGQNQRVDIAMKEGRSARIRRLRREEGSNNNKRKQLCELSKKMTD